MNEIIFGFDTEKTWDYENGYYLTSHPFRLSKTIAHWEIYKKIQNIPGEIVECGTFKGSSLIRFLTYREILESPYSRKVISFDAFGKFPPTDRPSDVKFIERFEDASGVGISKGELDKSLQRKQFQNYELVEGNVFDTIEPYLEKANALKIALLHIDVDVYDATLFCLNKLFDKVVRGGVIVFDDYCGVEGANKAIDEFLSAHPNYVIEKLGYCSVPSFIIK
jgi:hypothetical protein